MPCRASLLGVRLAVWILLQDLVEQRRVEEFGANLHYIPSPFRQVYVHD